MNYANPAECVPDSFGDVCQPRSKDSKAVIDFVWMFRSRGRAFLEILVLMLNSQGDINVGLTVASYPQHPERVGASHMQRAAYFPPRLARVLSSASRHPFASLQILAAFPGTFSAVSEGGRQPNKVPHRSDMLRSA